MDMLVIALKRLFEDSGHADAEQPLRAWYHEVQADWAGPHDIKARYAHASLLGNNRGIFHIGGNKYRLITVVDYLRKGVLIRTGIWPGLSSRQCQRSRW